MAKKKSNSNSKKTVEQTKKSPVSKNEKSMKEKVEIKSNSSDKASRIVGTIFIGLGVLLVAFGIYSFIQFRTDPTYDETLEVPTLEYVTEITNSKSISVKGKSEVSDTVAIFVNEEKVGEAKVSDGSFEYEYEVEGEGEYLVSVASLKGFPIRKISARTSDLLAIVDQTAPSDDVELVYGEETNKDNFKLTGSIEPKATIEIKRGVDSYTAIADEDGYFEITEISLDEGKNVYNVKVSDVAGNSTDIDEKIRVEYVVDGDVNGDAVADKYTQDSGKDVEGTSDTLPESSGELDNLVIRYLMIIFGIAAIFLFGGSWTYALSKKK